MPPELSLLFYITCLASITLNITQGIIHKKLAMQSSISSNACVTMCFCVVLSEIIG